MTTLNWRPADEQDAQFIGQCLRDDEAARLQKYLTGQRAQLTFVGMHTGALGSAVINVGGTPVAMLCAQQRTVLGSLLGLRAAILGLTPHAEGIAAFDPEVMKAVRRHVQGDALGMVGSAALDDIVQARWYRALGFSLVPEHWAPGCEIALYFTAQPGAQNLIEAYAASLRTPGALTTQH